MPSGKSEPKIDKTPETRQRDMYEEYTTLIERASDDEIPR